MALTVLCLKYFVLILILTYMTHNLIALEQPKGDGVADDTAAIQALLDTKASMVYLPPAPQFYLISKSLVIHSNQTLKLDPLTKIRLADNANDYLLVNDDRKNGNRNIRIIGGIWDGNNVHQTCIYRDGVRDKSGNDFYMGNIIFLMNIENLRLEGMTLKDPETFGAHLAKVRKFTVKDIIFDYNLELINEDGIHIKGPSSHGFIQNLKGNTNDDMVALNADDQVMFEVTRGPITDVRIDGLYAMNGYTAVRLLSAGSPVKRIHISDIFGTFRTNVISFTHFGLHAGEPSLFQDITVDHIYVARQLEPGQAPKKEVRHTGELTANKLTLEEAAASSAGLQPWWETSRMTREFFWIQNGVTIDNLSLSDVYRHEYLPGTRESLTIEKDATIRNLSLRNIIHDNKTDVPLPFIANEGTIEHLKTDSVIRLGRGDAVIGNGKILKSTGELFP